MDAELDELRRRVAELEERLREQSAQTERWRQIAEDRRATLERLRQRLVVRVLLRLARVLLPPVRRVQRSATVVVRRIRHLAASVRALPSRVTAPRRLARLRHRLAALPDPPSAGPRVAVVVLTRDGAAGLRRLLPSLADLRAVTEVVVVDNASGPETRELLASAPGITVVRNETNRTFSEACDQGVEASTQELVLFCNDDIEPLDRAWLDRMVAAIDEPGVVAAGAQLVYPRRGLLAGGARDLTVQHVGIAFEPREGRVPRAVNLSGGEADPGAPVRDVGAATAACLLVRREDHLAVGGFDPGYEYGAEDVDLCLRLRQRGRIVVVPGAVLFHHEGATRHRDDHEVRTARQRRNWERFESIWGPRLHRDVLRSRIAGEATLSTEPLRVGITVTRDTPEARYGDLYTATELATELERLGWDCRFVERYRDAWYDLPQDLDLLIVLHDLFDVRRVAREGLLTVAWVRNWAERWSSHPWVGMYDLLLCSSSTSAALLAERTGRPTEVFPLATADARFSAAPGGDRSGVVCTANNWGEDRDMPALVSAVPELRVVGSGWDDTPELAVNVVGPVPYEQLPSLYATSEVVVDQAAVHTRAEGSVNSRVFDALAAGAIVVSGQVEGCRELFGEDVPTFSNPAELGEVIAAVRADPEGTAARLSRARATVLAEHTYRRRAAQLVDLVRELADRPRVALRIGAPDRRVAPKWGDLHFAEAFGAALRGTGMVPIVQTLDEWDDARGKSCDIVVQLQGRSRGPVFPGQRNVLWIISHPDEVDDAELDAYDVVLAASGLLVEELRRRTGTPVHELLQATDPERFRPRPADPEFATEVLFLGNSRFVERPMVAAALAADLPLTIIGGDWDRFAPARVIARTHLPNDQVPVAYSSAAVVLNDHWDDMVRWGLVSNRLFDVLACGGCVVTDDVPGLEDLFGDAVAVADVRTIGAVVRGLLEDPERRRRMGARGRELVLADHTFAHRARTFASLVRPLLDQRLGLRQGAAP